MPCSYDFNIKVLNVTGPAIVRIPEKSGPKISDRNWLFTRVYYTERLCGISRQRFPLTVCKTIGSRAPDVNHPLQIWIINVITVVQWERLFLINYSMNVFLFLNDSPYQWRKESWVRKCNRVFHWSLGSFK